MLFVYFVGTEIYLLIFLRRKLGFEGLSRAQHER